MNLQIYFMLFVLPFSQQRGKSEGTLQVTRRCPFAQCGTFTQLKDIFNNPNGESEFCKERNAKCMYDYHCGDCTCRNQDSFSLL